MVRGHTPLSCTTCEHSKQLHTGLNKISHILTLFALWLLAGCTIDGYETASTPVTDQEIQLAGQIIGESISENQGGVLSTFGEAFAVPTSSGLTTGPSLLSSGSFRNLENYSHSFDAPTGEHRVTYNVRRETPLLSSAIEVELTYIIYDTDGSPIEFPERDIDRIESVDFRSEQRGNITTGSKNSVFSRTDRILMSGLNDQSEFLTLDGFHSGEGVFSASTATGSQVEREYFLDMNYLDIRINKDVVLSNRNFRNGVNGALSYESTVRDVSDGNGGGTGNAKIVNGTIEMNGDGTALLNFREQIEPLRLRLDDGDVFDEDEFEGRITKVDLENSMFTIANGQRIMINNQTIIEDGDFATLSEVASAVDNNVRVVAEGEYFQPEENTNLWIATDVEFEEESNEFQELVELINLSENRVTLINGDDLFLNSDSDIDFDDAFSSLSDVSNAVQNGLPVLADGEFSVNQQTGSRIVNEISFDLEFDEFESTVTAADSVSTVFSLANGRDVDVTSDTVLEGDYNSVAEVAQALEQGLPVQAKGDYYLGQSDELWIDVKVSFEQDDGDGDGSGDDDGDGDED